MKKIFIEAALLVVVVGLLWVGISSIDWVKLFNIRNTIQSTEKKIGELLWNVMKSTETEIRNDSVVAPVDSLLVRICKANSIKYSNIELYILKKDEVNAFALPDQQIVVCSGLILECNNAEELCGVLGHELAHIEENHVMNRLVREFGLAVLGSVVVGSDNGEITKMMIKQISSASFDRDQEREADSLSVSYLINAGINPSPFADLFYRMAENMDKMPDVLYWTRSHPESIERAEKIKQRGQNRIFERNTAKDSLAFIRLKETLRLAVQ